MKFSRSMGSLFLCVPIVSASVLFSAPAFAQTSPSAHTYGTRYDAMGRVTGTLAPDPDGAGALKYAATRNTYDAAGRLTKVETGELSVWKSQSIAPSSWVAGAPGSGAEFTVLSEVETSYDASGRKIQDKSFASNGAVIGIVQYSYDASGRLDCTVRRMNLATSATNACTLGTEATDGPDRITRNVYDAAGQVSKVQKAYATTLQQDYVTYTYDNNGNKLTVTDAGGNKALYAYDSFDRLYRWYFPSKTTPGSHSTTDYEQYSYDNGGNMTSKRTRRAHVIQYQYDALNRMTLKDMPVDAGIDFDDRRDVYYTYDNRGLQLSARVGPTTGYSGIINSYDGFGRLVTESQYMDGITRILTYEHNKNGARTKLTHWDGQWFGYGLDGLDRVASVKLAGTSTYRNYSYNNRGLLSGNTFATANLSSSLTYDNASRLNGLTHNASGTTNDVTWTFGYNPASQLATKTRTNNAYAWTGAANDDVAYQVNGLNQYTTADGASFTYDANGNLTSDGATTYTYDMENRLIAASGAGKNVSLRYDPLGRLYEVEDITASAKTRFLWDGDELIAEFNGTNVLLRRHLHGASVDDPIATFEGSVAPSYANVKYQLVDRQGSIIALVDQNGNVTDKNAYDEYGVPLSPTSGQPMVGRFGYTGQAWIPELGLWHYKARFYSPTLGRFIQVDPIGYEDQVNLYAYVGNDPINAWDPSGMCGFRKDDGSCEVRVPEDATQEEKDFAVELEGRLNHWDAEINKEGSNASAELADAWNNQEWSIVADDSNFAGAGRTSPGTTQLLIAAVAYPDTADALTANTREQGTDTLIFHEIGHTYGPGLAAAQANPPLQGPDGNYSPNPAAEGAANRQGSQDLQGLGGTFICGLTGYTC